MVLFLQKKSDSLYIIRIKKTFFSTFAGQFICFNITDMQKNLVIVESPAKAKIELKSFLGKILKSSQVTDIFAT